MWIFILAVIKLSFGIEFEAGIHGPELIDSIHLKNFRLVLYLKMSQTEYSSTDP